MSFNTFGKIFRFTTWGESHGPAIGCVIDGCPPNISIKENQVNQSSRPKEKKVIQFRFYLGFLKARRLVHQYP